MRYVYSADRLKDMLSYYKDTLEDIRKSLAVDKGNNDCEEIFDEVKSMFTKLENQALYEYEYALRNTTIPFWKKAEDVVPKPSICIDSIIKYAEDNGLKITGAFPTNVAAIDLSYETNDAIEEFTVEFQVQYWTSNTTS